MHLTWLLAQLSAHGQHVHNYFKAPLIRVLKNGIVQGSVNFKPVRLGFGSVLPDRKELRHYFVGILAYCPYFETRSSGKS
jgi:hypothetical protein